MSTTAIERKQKLICDILGIIFPKKRINNIGIETPQKITFTMPVLEHSRATGPTSHEVSFVETRFFIVWNNNFDFELWKKVKGKLIQETVPSSTWFKVRDLIRQRFLDAEKLKHP